MVRIGVIACDMIQLELEKVLPEYPEVVEIVWLESALHVYPERMKQTIIERINEMKARADVIFLGYGYCQSLKGIEQEVDIPVVLPQHDDCLAILLTPERYAEEKKKECGTWFMTPGWAEVGADMVIKELHLDRAERYGRKPLDMARRLFTHYKRGLYIDTGVGDNEHFITKAKEFCTDFSLTLERTAAQPVLLATWLEKCRQVTLENQE